MTETKKKQLLTEEEYAKAAMIYQRCFEFTTTKAANPTFCWMAYEILLVKDFGQEKGKAIFAATLGSTFTELAEKAHPQIRFASYKTCLKRLRKQK